MGNETSDFEDHFHKLYNFVAVVQDPYFRAVKVYRKNRYNFTHIMVAQQPVAPLPGTTHHSAKALLADKLALIRRFQSRHTVQLEYFHLLEERKYECGLPAVRMYIDYYNYTLLDYLSALRLKRQPLALEELLLVVQSLAQAMLTIRKMGIEQYRMGLGSVYLIVEDGAVLLNPVYFLYDNIYQAFNANAIPSLKHDFDLSTHHHSPNSSHLETRQKQQLRSIAIEMTRYLSQSSLGQSENILRTLDGCQTVAEIAKIFVSPIDELNVQQFGQTSEEAAKLY